MNRGYQAMTQRCYSRTRSWLLRLARAVAGRFQLRYLGVHNAGRSFVNGSTEEANTDESTQIPASGFRLAPLNVSNLISPFYVQQHIRNPRGPYCETK